MNRILVTRTDRLGDVLLATPVLKRLREAFPHSKICFLVQPQWMSVLQYGNEIEMIEYRSDESSESLATRLKNQAFDSAIVLRDEAKVTRAIRLAGIPHRVGPYSTLRSFFSFNHGKFQRRSLCRMHEAEYNLDLLTRLGVEGCAPAREASGLPRSWVAVSDDAEKRVMHWLSGQKLLSGNFIGFHPGSSGSARYLSREMIIGLLQALRAQGEHVVLTGGPQEIALLRDLEQAASGHNQGSVRIFEGTDLTSLDALAALYRHARVVVAHGTGPLHLAAAVGTPVFAVFPPLFVLSEKRWGPLTSKREVWIPDVSCPEKFRCRGEKCRYYDCMDRFEIQGALKKIERLARST